ncbi:flavonol synthase/flavanone 3-hydroxylase [Phtheirospermum japonicum]|uniref:Flavonol synthase/flavanone 3-hydroxylase n=1 Tax=Phtheirospermum japonicum TaxID=374723 RepID=A0A830BUV8_9LAMI|nr:flavonol synthase/flavanone 3-hydroxylase [Phtheirospermum japonicum]
MERVQSIASLSNNTIPSQYIRSTTEQPAATTVHGVVLEVPVIDIGGDEIDKIVESVSEASLDWGIFQVVNHGIPNEVIAKLQKVGRQFFELPHEEKDLIAKTPQSGIEGYGTNLQKEIEGKRGWVDHLFHKIWPSSVVKYDFWPKNPPEYREATEEYGQRLREVSDKLVKWLSLGLGLDDQQLKVAMGGDDTVFLMKINYYPPCPRPDLALGVVAHTDMSALTILVPNEIQGLQVFRDGHWYDVKYIPNALIIHIGDQIEILSNGKYKAVFHRTTVNKESTRMSWPVFLEPPAEHEIGPIPDLVNEQSPPKYKTKKYKDYAYCKLNKIPQ